MADVRKERELKAALFSARRHLAQAGIDLVKRDEEIAALKRKVEDSEATIRILSGSREREMSARQLAEARLIETERALLKAAIELFGH